jgi:hypothetical protein
VGAGLLDDLRAAVGRYVVPPSPEALDAITLWIAATHLQAAWQHAPRMAIVAPTKACGKSRLLDVLHETVHNPFITVNASPSAIFRSITEPPPTLLVDEADTIFGSARVAEKNEEMRGLLNAGHQRNRPTTRVMGSEHKPVQFPTFAMAAIAGIGDLPDTIMDRAVVIRMRKRLESERVDDFRTRTDVPFLQAVRARLADWSGSQLKAAAVLVPAMPVRDRAADTWEPLVAVADLAGGAWPQRARTACQVMTDREKGNEHDRGAKIRILVDIRSVFAEHGDPSHLPTETLLHALKSDSEAPWHEHGSQGLTARGLQILLKDYEISPTNRRFDDGTQRRGYARPDFADAWNRYCPAPQPVAPPPRSHQEALPTGPERSEPDTRGRPSLPQGTQRRAPNSGLPPAPSAPGTGPRR